MLSFCSLRLDDYKLKTLLISEKRQSFQLDLDSLTPPPMSFSAPELSSRCMMPFKALRNAVSSSQLLHELAMARVHKAVAMKEEQTKNKDDRPPNRKTDIPYNTSFDRDSVNNDRDMPKLDEEFSEAKPKNPEILTKPESVDSTQLKFGPRQVSLDSEISDPKWQHMSFDEDYTASTVSSDGEYTDDGSLDGDNDRRSQFSNEEDTYNPRDKMARPSPLKDFIEEEEEELSESEPLKLLPLPDPNFVPKPILKRRESDMVESKPAPEPEKPKIEEKPTITEKLKTANKPKSIEKPKAVEKPKPDEKPKLDKKPKPDEQLKVAEKPKAREKPKKEEKITIFKKITNTKFPKLLHKKEPEKLKEESLPNDNPKTNNKTDKLQDKISDEGRTVIDYYGSIVKEYGSQKKSTAPIYLKTEDLKAVAEKQQLDTKPDNVEENKTTKPKKITNKTTNNKVTSAKGKTANSVNKSVKPKQTTSTDKNQLEKKGKITIPNPPEMQNNTPKKCTQQVVLKAERATIVIPINYQELEEKAKMNVRSAIDYTVDVCLLLLAFWVYFFKDERLAIPFLILIIYRQLQETLMLNIPEWYELYTPSWLKKKTS